MPNNKYILNSLFIHHSSLRDLNISNRSISKKKQVEKILYIFFITIDFGKVLRSTTGETKKKDLI